MLASTAWTSPMQQIGSGLTEHHYQSIGCGRGTRNLQERMTVKQLKNLLTPDRFDAVLFDMDGVLTSTAKIHSAAWKTTFDEFLATKGGAMTTGQYRPFDPDKEYKVYVDGKLRYEGVRSFLESRGIHLPEGSPDDTSEMETVCGLGNRKDSRVKAAIGRGEAEAYPGSIALLNRVRQLGIRTGVVSSSNNCEDVLRATRILDLFDVRVDGHVATQLNLPGKPAPDTFLKAAELLGVPPKRAVVVEDAISGVQAGRDGEFGLVIGVDRGGNAEALQANGATVLVTDLSELL